MTKFQIECPNCQKNTEYNIVGRNYDKIKCSNCNKGLDVQMRYIVPVISLTVFFICYQLYALIIREFIPLWLAFLLGIVITFVLTVLIGQILVKKFGSGVFFEINIKEQKKEKKA